MRPEKNFNSYIGFSRIFSGAFGFLLHVIFFARMATVLNSDMFEWAVRKTGAVAWAIFIGIPCLMAVVWAVKLTWPITASRNKRLFIVLALTCQIVPALLGWWIGQTGLWSK